MPEFNLIDESWIPCIDLYGNRKEYGILETFNKAHELREVSDDSPLVTAAIHRLLLAILYRAYEGPRDYAAWDKLYRAGQFVLTAPLSVYLQKWRDRFDLVSPNYPFYQMAGLKMDKTTSVIRLATACSSGNNPTLFDHSQDELEVMWLPARVTKELVACQSFALGFGKSGKARIDGAETEEVLPYSSDAIALRGMNVWLQADNLFKTLLLNLSPLVDDNSLPPWELDGTNCHRDRDINGKKTRVSSFGKVDRLTWQSRLIKLLPEDDRFSKMYFTQGRTADKGIGDPMKVYRKSNKEGIVALPLSSIRAVWRDSHSLFMIPEMKSGEVRPESFNVAARLEESGDVGISQKVDIHVVGLATAQGKAGKFILWRHERLLLQYKLLSDVNLIERLGLLLQESENAAREIYYRASRIAKLFLKPDAENSEGRQPDKNALSNLTENLDPRPIYWARLEKYFYLLLETLPDDWDSINEDWKPDEQQDAANVWRDHITKEAQRALEESMLILGSTGRAIQAIARVRTDICERDIMESSLHK